jgi:hypothetical protein
VWRTDRVPVASLRELVSRSSCHGLAVLPASVSEESKGVRESPLPLWRPFPGIMDTWLSRTYPRNTRLLRVELVYRCRFATRQQARQEMLDYIELWSQWGAPPLRSGLRQPR